MDQSVIPALAEFAAKAAQEWPACEQLGVSDDGSLLPVLSAALDQMASIDAQSLSANGKRPNPPGNINQIGADAIDVLLSLSVSSEIEESCIRDIQLGCVAVAQWVARHGGELSEIDIVVNVLASLGKDLQDPGQLGALSVLMKDLKGIVDRKTRLDLVRDNPMRPWRILHINRAIVATRSHDPAHMEDAFADLVEYLPDDARRFFTDGIELMTTDGYPEPVRAVMQRYYDAWGGNQTLQ